MSHNIHISARFRKEPDYGRLARALLQFLEEEEAAAHQADIGLEGQGHEQGAAAELARGGQPAAEGQQ